MMVLKLNEKLNFFLKILVIFFPILIILGPFFINLFSLIFSCYSIINYKNFHRLKILDKNKIIIFFSFIFLIFPFNSVNFENSFFKYVSFLRFPLMFFGLIFFLNNQNLGENILQKMYKNFCIILIIITIDVIKEYISGSNILGFSSNYAGRIASFTNDELIIGYIYVFLSLFSIVYIYKNSSIFFFNIVIISLIIISFLIGERSNFIKLTFLLTTFFTLVTLTSMKLNIKKKLSIIILFFLFIVSAAEISKNTYVGKKLFFSFDKMINYENKKIKIDLKNDFFDTKHSAHYITAYRIFIDNPIFGIGINNFFIESNKIKYRLKKNNQSSTHPHQVYLEIISELGLVGSLYFIFIFFYPIYLSLKIFCKTKNTYILSHLFLHIFFIFPILPSGSIFGTVIGVPFWLNLAILFYLNIYPLY